MQLKQEIISSRYRPKWIIEYKAQKALYNFEHFEHFLILASSNYWMYFKFWFCFFDWYSYKNYELCNSIKI